MSGNIVIIGAGIAGLSAGCYLQMNGYKTKIFELHHSPGGLCTSWKRGDYIFDGCIGLLSGATPEDEFYHIWNELIDMKSLKIVMFRECVRVEDKNGQYISVRTNLDELEQELLEKAPEDKELITEFIEVARELRDGKDLKDLKEWVWMPLAEFAKKCKNPLLGRTLKYLFIQEMPVFFPIMFLGWLHKKTAGYPIGGSLKFARLFEKKYLELGGEINYNSRVKKVLTKDNAAAGVQMENGEKHEADIVISAADGYSTIFEMLAGKYTDKEILHYYDDYKTFPSYLVLSLGISRTFPDAPHVLSLPMEKPLVIDPGTSIEDIGAAICSFDPTLAPEGKTVLNSMICTNNYKYWVDLRQQNPGKYKKEKQRIINEFIAVLEKRFGNIASNVEETDISTPATVIRYTNNWKGSMEGWLISPDVGSGEMKKSLPGLRDFYMAGQWVEPGGGLSQSCLSGRNIARFICQSDNKQFTTK